MKLHICINKQPINGYTHIDPQPKGNVPAFTGTIDKITDLCNKAECEEILAPEMLDYISIGQIDAVLDIFVSLLRHGGELVLGGNESNEVSRHSFLSLLDLESLNNILYGFSFRKNAVYSVDFIQDKLEKKGLKITNIKLDSYKFIIRCFRP